MESLPRGKGGVAMLFKVLREAQPVLTGPTANRPEAIDEVPYLHSLTGLLCTSQARRVNVIPSSVEGGAQSGSCCASARRWLAGSRLE